MCGQSVTAGQSEDLNVELIRQRLGELAKNASNGCGSSHDVYVQKFSASVDREFSREDSVRQDVIIELAREFDYASPAEIEEEIASCLAMGYCSHGLDPNCCPVGCGDIEDPADGPDYDNSWEQHVEKDTLIACVHLQKLSLSIHHSCGEFDECSAFDPKRSSRYTELFTKAVDHHLDNGWDDIRTFDVGKVLEVAELLGYQPAPELDEWPESPLTNTKTRNAIFGWLIPRWMRRQSPSISVSH